MRDRVALFGGAAQVFLSRNKVATRFVKAGELVGVAWLVWPGFVAIFAGEAQGIPGGFVADKEGVFVGNCVVLFRVVGIEVNAADSCHIGWVAGVDGIGGAVAFVVVISGKCAVGPKGKDEGEQGVAGHKGLPLWICARFYCAQSRGTMFL